jgi:deoxycytidine triphosphate deaminase
VNFHCKAHSKDFTKLKITGISVLRVRIDVQVIYFNDCNNRFVEKTLVKVLNREEIAKQGNKLIAPFDKDCLTPVGYDLRVGGRMVNFRTANQETLSPSYSVVIPPGERFAVETLEKVQLKDTIFAFVFTKVSVLWDGLTSLGTRIDPGFSDNMWLIFANDSNRPYALKYGKKICNVMFFEYDNPAKEIDVRGRPSLLAIPAVLPVISDSSQEEDIKRDFGYGISSVVSYFRPKLQKQARRLKTLEKFKGRITYFVFTISATVVAGLILWLLGHGGV